MTTMLAALTVFVFGLAGDPVKLAPNQAISIQHHKLMVLPIPTGPVEVIDSKGNNVAISVDGDIVNLKPPNRYGYTVGPMTVRSGGREFMFIVRGQP
jgi:hypothetical protein